MKYKEFLLRVPANDDGEMIGCLETAGWTMVTDAGNGKQLKRPILTVIETYEAEPTSPDDSTGSSIKWVWNK